MEGNEMSDELIRLGDLQSDGSIHSPLRLTATQNGYIFRRFLDSVTKRMKVVGLNRFLGAYIPNSHELV